ncbi:MAG: hypothetical protein OES47_04145 [Acidobacteriota bacterium]|nr:hypothetical protein [Acidobacteriota bacterium]
MEPEETEIRPTEDSRPFEPGPANLTGCGKPVVIGCLVLLVLLAAGMILLLTQSNRLMSWTMNQVKAQVMAELPPAVETEERDRLAAAFESATAALAAGDIDPEDLQSLQRVVAEVQASGGKLSAEQVEEVTLLLEEIGDSGSSEGPQESDERSRTVVP